eukprot:GHVO01022303.1.p2 GENE.GHVO01022303.1~~GHVO01022303.1.p2  ORF type:complete len:125 (+),score=24.15 GHVO01022303.1:28-402(+)
MSHPPPPELELLDVRKRNGSRDKASRSSSRSTSSRSVRVTEIILGEEPKGRDLLGLSVRLGLFCIEMIASMFAFGLGFCGLVIIGLTLGMPVFVIKAEALIIAILSPSLLLMVVVILGDLSDGD